MASGVITGATPPIPRTTQTLVAAQSAFSNWAQSLNTPNTANAVVTGVFNAFANLRGSITAGKIYDLFEQQEQEAIRASFENARRAKLRGDIDLRNLVYRHALMQGTQELAVAAGGGNLSGSNLDVLSQNYRFNSLDERTQAIQNLWDVSDIKRQGYLQAYQSAGDALQYAFGQEANALALVSGFISGAAKGLIADKAQAVQTEHFEKVHQLQRDLAKQRQQAQYGSVDKGDYSLEDVGDFYNTTGGIASGLIDWRDA